MEDIFKREVAELIVKAVLAEYKGSRETILAALNVDLPGFGDVIYAKLETPKDRQQADLALPVFFLSSILKLKPHDIANKICERLDPARFTVVGPYINTFLAASVLARSLLPEIFVKDKDYAGQAVGQNRRIVIDFSSPNIAKPFGVGHLRSTAIGHSLYLVFAKLGYQPIGINHLGDWGTQFGKMIVAYRRWGNSETLTAEPIKTLYDLYVRFHQEEEKDPTLTAEARLWFKKLEEGDKEALHLWELFREYSLREFQRIYDILGVSFDRYTGESFYNDKTEAVIDRLRQVGLAVESQGALVVPLEQYGMPACLLKKSDGATLYATRELAGIFYRQAEFDFYKALYVVGAEQTEHFKQVFKVVELMGESFADRLVHVEFGWIRFKDEAMSTRRGNIVFLEEVIDTAMKKAVQIIRDKNPALPHLEETARMVALGAIIFADLGVRKHKDVNFSWEEVLNFEGETGPYLQYTHARLAALERKYGREITAEVDFNNYNSSEEKELLLHLYRFGQTIEAIAEKYEPSFMAEYLLELAGVFNRFYQRKDNSGRLIRIISDNEEETGARMLLVRAVRIVLNEGLRLMGISAPEEM